MISGSVFPSVRVDRCLKTLITGKVSLDRMDEFLKETELLDSFSEPQPSIPKTHDKGVIGFKNAAFSWSFEPQDGSLTPRSRSFKLRINEELLFKPNCINLIVGPTYGLYTFLEKYASLTFFRGSGKTSMLMALLGLFNFSSHMERLKLID